MRTCVRAFPEQTLHLQVRFTVLPASHSRTARVTTSCPNEPMVLLLLHRRVLVVAAGGWRAEKPGKLAMETRIP